MKPSDIDNSIKILSEIVFADGITDEMLTTTEFEVLRTGTFYDSRYGKFTVDEKLLEELEVNFNKKVLGVDVAVDKNHEWQNGAMAWVASLRKAGNRLLASFKEYSEEGKKSLREKIFKYFSVEFAPLEKVDERGEKVTINNVLRGIALTTRPVIKGMKPAFFSESILFNFPNMDKFKLFAEELKAKAKVSKEDFGVLKGMCKMLSEDEQKEAQPAVDEVEKKVEEEAAPAPEAPEAPAPSAPAEGEMSDKKKTVSLAEFKALESTVKTLSELNEAMSEELTEKRLSEEFKNELVLSEDVKRGFQKADEEEVVGFMKTLSEDQLSTFKALIGKVSSVEMSKLGANFSEKNVESKKFSQDDVAERAEKLLADGTAKNITDAQKMAAKQLSAGK